MFFNSNILKYIKQSPDLIDLWQPLEGVFLSLVYMASNPPLGGLILTFELVVRRTFPRNILPTFCPLTTYWDVGNNSYQHPLNILPTQYSAHTLPTHNLWCLLFSINNSYQHPLNILPTQHSAHILSTHNLLWGWFWGAINTNQHPLNIFPTQPSSHILSTITFCLGSIGIGWYNVDFTVGLL